MIRNNMIYFGKGTIIGGIDLTNHSLRFSHVSAPLPIGPILKNTKDVLFTVSFPYKEDFKLLAEKVKSISPENQSFTFRDYVFDFSEYNDYSVQSVLDDVNLVSFSYFFQQLESIEVENITIEMFKELYFHIQNMLNSDHLDSHSRNALEQCAKLIEW